MDIATARGWVRQFARNAQDSSIYSDADIDRAIQAVCSRFCRNTRVLVSQTSAALLAGDTTFIVQNPSPSFGAGQTPIMPEQFMAAWFSDQGDPLTMIDQNTLTQIIATNTDLDGNVLGTTPVYGAINGSFGSIGVSGFVISFWPATAIDQTALCRFWQPFGPIWNPGDNLTNLGVSVTLNLPDHWLQQILPLGPPAQLQMHEKENNAMASAKWEKYLKLEQSFMGAGILGKRVAIRRKQA